MVMVAQLWDNIKNQSTVYFKRVNFIIFEIYLNEAAELKKQAQTPNVWVPFIQRET